MKHLLSHLVAGRTLDLAQTIEAFELIMTGQASPAQIAALLAILQTRGATEDELVGAATVMRRKVTLVPVPPGLTVIDTCGTGGTHSRTFNISTTAGLVAAAVGRARNVVVAKHGNRAVTSATGSSQVLEALGVKLRVQPDTLARCLDEAGFCFCFAPAFHPAMKFAAPVRADLGFRTLFNVLGPITNPAGAKRQVMGVFSPALTEPLARVLQRLGAEDAMLVHGRACPDAPEDALGLGELTTTGPTRITRLHRGSITTTLLDPRTLGLPMVSLDDLSVPDPAASAAVVRAVLDGAHGPARDIVCLNAAAALLVADIVSDLREGIALAAGALDHGDAAAVLDRLIRLTQADPTPQG